MSSDLVRRIAAEGLGAALLTAVVIGSGIMGARLADGNDGVALLANTLATAAILFVLITALSPISGAHFNPAVTLVEALRGNVSAPAALGYVVVQTFGCAAGVTLAHALFELPLIQVASTAREGAALFASEAAATFALVACILLVGRSSPGALPAAVALTIAAGYWWSSSTSFANPAITIARAMSDTFAGIRPQDAPSFIAAQIMGAVLALFVCDWLMQKQR